MSRAEWQYLPAHLPPPDRIVLLLMSHQSEPVVMRKYAVGSWRSIEGRAEWCIAGEARDWEKWGWYLIGWASLPPIEDHPLGDSQ